MKSSHDELQESVAQLKNMQSSAGFMNQLSNVSKVEERQESKLSQPGQPLMMD